MQQHVNSFNIFILLPFFGTLKHVEISTCNSPLLCLRWKGQKTKTNKKPVTLISTIHDPQELLTTKKDSHGNRLPKSQIIFKYTKDMSGVDLSDQ